MGELTPPIRRLEDGRRIDLVPMTYGKVRLLVSGERSYRHGFYDDGW